MMRERPILFSAPMVKAILDGRKSMTRRVVRPQPYLSADGNRWRWRGKEQGVDNPIRWILLPTGPFQGGQLLWVRESFAFITDPFAVSVGVRYAADGAERWFGSDNPSLIPNERTVYNSCGKDYPSNVRFSPSIHIPRWASRITLELTGVRVEHIQGMTFPDWVADFCPSKLEQERALASFVGQKNMVDMAQTLWDSINSKRGFGWDTNPWVWVIEFKRVEDEGRKI